MKHYYRQILGLWLLAVCYMLCTSSSCKKEEQPSTPETELAKLPPETQEGKNTFGCLVNGKAFLPKGSGFSGANLTSYYQHVVMNNRAGQFFQVSCANKSNPSDIYSVTINTDSISLKVGTYIIESEKKRGSVSGLYSNYNESATGNVFITTDQNKGTLKVNRFDEIKQIASGAFSFDAINASGEKVEVRNGRFDVVFTK